MQDQQLLNFVILLINFVDTILGHVSKYSFELAMLGVGTTSGVLFWTGMQGGRNLVGVAPEIRRDATLAVAVGWGGAFFVGTDSWYHGNWLQGLVGERSGKPGDAGMDILKAGLSSTLGFLFCQLVLNVLLPVGISWTDPPRVPQTSNRDGFSAGSSRFSPLGVGGAGLDRAPSRSHRGTGVSAESLASSLAKRPKLDEVLAASEYKLMNGDLGGGYEDGNGFRLESEDTSGQGRSRKATGSILSQITA
jgi:hypothetical protein